MLKRIPHFLLLLRLAVKNRGGVFAVASLVHRKVQNDGFRSIWMKAFNKLQYHNNPYAHLPSISLDSIESCAEELLSPRILIIAEVSIPQCTKYRVMQKKELFEQLGVECTVQDWTDMMACLDLLSTHSMVIFYRVPGHQQILDVINEAKRLNLQTYWEVDDLIFDRQVLEGSSNVSELDSATRKGVLNGADLYKEAMLACGKAVASTQGLADEMLKKGVSEVIVVENALDEQTLLASSEVLKNVAVADDGIVRIVYGSGTNTHDADFRECEDALLEILARYSNVHFCLIGTLNLSSKFKEYEARIERTPFCSYEEYLSLLSQCDISIAPLENYIFNEGKSNIKFLEASVVKLPSICSARSAFKKAILHKKSGFLCDGTTQWLNAFIELIEDSGLRKNVGEAAYSAVMQNYAPETIGAQQLKPILIGHNRKVVKKRVLSVNIFYSPKSFGGATIVAEQVNKLLQAKDDFDVSVFTSLPQSALPDYSLRRYEVDGAAVYGISLPAMHNEKLAFENPNLDKSFIEVLGAVKPDLVHFHCIQDMGISLMDICTTFNVPYHVTLHDAWWLCGRQFLIDKKGKFCPQEKIDLSICDKCVVNPKLNRYRYKKLGDALMGACQLMAPSQNFADFYQENVKTEGGVCVNKNGILFPEAPLEKELGSIIRFGYVGGNTEVKGFDLVKNAFKSLGRSDVELVVVDNTMNLGYSSFSPHVFKGIEPFKLVPAYTQDSIDDFFASIDVLLFPTQCRESFGLTVREAIVRDVWVISTDAGGVVEDILPGKNGTVIPLNSTASDLREAVLDVAKLLLEARTNAQVIQLPKSHISSFSDQADELAEFFLEG